MRQTIQNEFSDVLTGSGCFEGMFTLRLGEGSCPYQAPPRRVAYALQQPGKEELNRLQKQYIIISLDVHETSEWFNSSVLVPMPTARYDYAWI